MKPALLVLIKLARARLARFSETFEVIDAAPPGALSAALARDGSRVRIVLTNGSIGLAAEAHVGGWSNQAVDASMQMFMRNARHHLAGEPVLTPV